MPVKPGYLFLAGGGGVLVWSGLKGKSISSVFRQLAGGDAPQNASSANPVAAVTPSTGASTAASNPGGASDIIPEVAAGASQTAWNTALLTAIGAPPTPANLSSLANWEAHEEPTSDWNHANNPMNTTQQEVGSTSFNSDGVQTYTDLSLGLSATVKTLENGDYPDILSQLRAGKGLLSGASAGLLKWSGGAYSSV